MSTAYAALKLKKLSGLIAEKAAGDATRPRKMDTDVSPADLSTAAKKAPIIVESAPVVPGVAARKGNGRHVEPLGLGMKHVGFGAAPVAPAAFERYVYHLCSVN